MAACHEEPSASASSASAGWARSNYGQIERILRTKQNHPYESHAHRVATERPKVFRPRYGCRKVWPAGRSPTEIGRDRPMAIDAALRRIGNTASEAAFCTRIRKILRSCVSRASRRAGPPHVGDQVPENQSRRAVSPSTFLRASSVNGSSCVKMRRCSE